MDTDGHTALHWATVCQTTKCVTLLCSSGHVDVNKRDNLGCTALHYAAQADNTDIVQELLKHKGDTAACDNFGRTPVMWAACSGSVKCLKLLVSADIASLHVRDNNSLTPLHCAAALGQIEVVKEIVNFTDDTDVEDDEGREN